jgi:hypothetical protein
MSCSNNNTLAARFWTKVDKGGDCWEWTGARHPQGYGLIRTMTGMNRAHRVSYEISNGAIPTGLMVRHKCDNPSCVNPEHLAIGTALDNVHDRVARGRSADRRGERHPLAKLNSVSVEHIRASPLPGKSLAEIFGVSQASVSLIRSNKRWSRL